MFCSFHFGNVRIRYKQIDPDSSPDNFDYKNCLLGSKMSIWLLFHRFLWIFLIFHKLELWFQTPRFAQVSCASWGCGWSAFWHVKVISPGDSYFWVMSKKCSISTNKGSKPSVDFSSSDLLLFKRWFFLEIFQW